MQTPDVHNPDTPDNANPENALTGGHVAPQGEISDLSEEAIAELARRAEQPENKPLPPQGEQAPSGEMINNTGADPTERPDADAATG